MLMLNGDLLNIKLCQLLTSSWTRTSYKTSKALWRTSSKPKRRRRLENKTAGDFLNIKYQSKKIQFVLNRERLKSDIFDKYIDILMYLYKINIIIYLCRKYKSPVNKTMATIDKADTSFAHSKPNPADIDMTKVFELSPIIAMKKVFV